MEFPDVSSRNGTWVFGREGSTLTAKPFLQPNLHYFCNDNMLLLQIILKTSKYLMFYVPVQYGRKNAR